MAMKPFAYASAASLDDALGAMSDACRPLAGGTDLLNMIKADLTAPERLLDIKRIPSLAELSADDETIRFGAAAPLLQAGAFAAQQGLDGLAQAIQRTASPQIRHMGTLGGNLLQRPRCWYFRNADVDCLRKGGKRCFAFRGENKYHAIMGGGPCYIVHPSDPAVALLALDASVALVGPNGQRQVPLGEFFLLPKQDAHSEVALASDELLTKIVVPTPPADARSAYLKIAERGSWDFALVSVAAQLAFDGDDVASARIALGGVAPVPWLAEGASEALVGHPLTDETILAAAKAATKGARPLEQNGYKIAMVQGAIKQVLRDLT
jgi:xanthine dehydrogenase YagS FAD-binding subunit